MTVDGNDTDAVQTAAAEADRQLKLALRNLRGLAASIRNCPDPLKPLQADDDDRDLLAIQEQVAQLVDHKAGTPTDLAGMAEAYYTPLAPHNPQGPCSLAASLQIAASIPNFLVQERGDNEYADLLAKPLPPLTCAHRPLPTQPGLGITIDEDKLMAQVGEPRPYRAAVDRRRRAARVGVGASPRGKGRSPTPRPAA